MVKKSPSQLQLSHRVTLSEAKGLSRSADEGSVALGREILRFAQDDRAAPFCR